MASTVKQTMEFLNRFVRDVPAKPISGTRVEVLGFEGGVVNHLVPLGDMLNEVPGGYINGVRKATGEGRYFIANWDDPETGDLEHCGVVLREIGKGRR